jgi:hypothetical protein
MERLPARARIQFRFDRLAPVVPVEEAGLLCPRLDERGAAGKQLAGRIRAAIETANDDPGTVPEIDLDDDETRLLLATLEDHARDFPEETRALRHLLERLRALRDARRRDAE